MLMQRWLMVAALVAACEAGDREGGEGGEGVELDAPEGEGDGDNDDAPPPSEPDPDDPDDTPDPDGDPDSTRTTDQRLFNFTIVADREQFEATDLVFKETIGPYAMYEVTGPAPRLEGPLVVTPEPVKYTMLCAATEYFASADGAEPARAILFGGRDGSEEWVALTLQPEGDDECSDPADRFNSAPTFSEDEMPTGKLVVALEPAPEVGSVVLLRQVAMLVDTPGHNDSHATPSVCCDKPYGECELN